MSAENFSSDATVNGASKKRLRIAVLSRNFVPTAGGAERYAIAMVEQLALQHDITVFSQSIEHSWPNVVYEKVSSPLKRPRWVNQLWFASLTWWATRRGFDIVHSHENTWHGNVQTVHVMPVRHNLFKNQSGQTKSRQLLVWLRVLTSPRLMVYMAIEQFRYAPQRGRRVVVTSPMLLEVFKACFPAAAGITSVVTPGIKVLPVEQAQANQVDKANQADRRRLLGLPQAGECLLFVGNDYKKKGLQTLLEALTKLPLDVALAVVGASRQTGFFKQQAVALGLESRVFFLGALTDMAPAYRAATCLVHPTREDTFAMVVLEAMAFGLPVVVSNAEYCGISALLKHCKNALLLRNPLDADELAQMVSMVLVSSELRTGLGQQARSFAECFDWRKLANAQEAIYFDAVKGISHETSND